MKKPSITWSKPTPDVLHTRRLHIDGSRVGEFDEHPGDGSARAIHKVMLVLRKKDVIEYDYAELPE